MNQTPPPEIAQRGPYMKEDLPPGTYLWCACGRTKTQPFCDGSHQGGPHQPLRFTVTPRSGTLWLCGCKRSRTPPFCDGAHNKLPRV
ncbi:MAG TPA: CDGSH iron-sulfur domain-containing protein [Nevskiaceae bacterium]|nr:CDGSH iron-sulfur domain-containing protein [Nevskiaceae bacterium]